MKTKLFTALPSCHLWESKDFLENFTTEAFAWLLINRSGFGRFYLFKVRGRLGLGEEENRSAIEWTTRLKGIKTPMKRAERKRANPKNQ